MAEAMTRTIPSLVKLWATTPDTQFLEHLEKVRLASCTAKVERSTSHQTTTHLREDQVNGRCQATGIIDPLPTLKLTPS
jgi:hypothetical protein